MTLVDLADLKAALAMLRDAERKRDAALAENARLRAAVWDVLRHLGHFPVARPAKDGEMCRSCGFTWPCILSYELTAALAAPTADDGAERGAR